MENYVRHGYGMVLLQRSKGLIRTGWILAQLLSSTLHMAL